MTGVVYRAIDPALKRTVALKTVRLSLSIPEKERKHFERRFLAEAQLAARLSHPNIVVVHDVGRDSRTGTLFIALEYLEGSTLNKQMEEGFPMHWREALGISSRLADALHHAHSHGIVHRDVKPANIMLLPSGEPKIMDFGIAKAPNSQLTTPGKFFGTPCYMSPEQACGETMDGRSDLFSLGSVLYLLLTGRRAFDGEEVATVLGQVLYKEPPAPSTRVAGLSTDIDYLVARCVSKSPAERYPDGKALAEDSEDILRGLPPRHRADWRLAPTVEGTLVSPASVAAPRAAGLPVPTSSPAKPEAHSYRLGRRGVLALGGLVVAALLTILSTRPEKNPPQLRFLAPPLVVKPGRLVIAFEHGLKSGSLWVWIDGKLVLGEPLESRVTRNLLLYQQRRGALTEVLEISPGEHVVGVRVEGDGYYTARSIRGSFESGETRHLEVSVGWHKKEVSLEWKK